MSSKYVDNTSILQVIACIFLNPNLLSFNDKYTFNEEDFPDEFHKIVFGSIYNLYDLGAKQITIANIVDYLSTRPKSEAIFRQNKGEEWLLKIKEAALPEAFDYYYSRLKKMTLLRAYDNFGIDVSFIYDVDNILDSKKKQLQEDFLDNSSLETIAEKIDNRIEEIKLQYVDNSDVETYQAGDGIMQLIQNLKDTPGVGIPMYGSLINTITRGARLKKLYLRSAPTGVGKSRTMIADACNFACNKIYDETFGWIKNGTCEPTLYITTEQEVEEVQTMMLAFLSNVNEDLIIKGRYEGNEEERVVEAAKILQSSPLYIEELPDFSLKDIENRIKKNIRDNDVRYVTFDYIHTSLKILEEITRRSGGVKLREDNILFMLAIRLKDLCNEYGIFILTSTQLNGDYVDSKTPDQNLLRGAKSIGDKVDWGSILLPVTQEDIDSLSTVLSNSNFDTPNLKLSIYKNRRGRYKSIYLWCKADLGTCRVNPMFCTGYNYDFIEMEDLKIEVEESAF